MWACGAVGSALPWHGRGREFESHQVHQIPQILTKNGTAQTRFWSPTGVQKWTPPGCSTSLQQRLVKTGGWPMEKHARYHWLLLAEGDLTRGCSGRFAGKNWCLSVGSDPEGAPTTSQWYRYSFRRSAAKNFVAIEAVRVYYLTFRIHNGKSQLRGFMDLRGYKSYFGLLFLLAAFVAGPAVRRASADVMYTYTGNAFDTFPTGASCPPVCNVTGSFVVADSLAADLPEFTVIDPISFSLISAGVTLTDGEGQGTDSFLGVATDSTGAIIEWSWVEVGPASAPTARILTENVPGSVVADDVRLGTNAPPLVGPRLGQISNDPGTWKETAVAPEPAGLPLLAIGLLGIVAFGRRARA
jgi:hypothetical protein